MPSTTVVTNKVDAILFDMNGTLRKRIPDEDWQRQSLSRLLTLLEKPEAPASFLDELTRRYKSYTKWADEFAISLPEAEIWTQWMTPELSHKLVAPRAAELMLAFRNRNGKPELKPDAAAVIAELNQRGYRMGVISNTTSTLDIPTFIEEHNLKDFFEVVILSAACGIRKPHRDIFWEATRAMRLEPGQCAYLGNKISIDVVGARKAGFSLAMIINPILAMPGKEKSSMVKPDIVIHELKEMLEVFPMRL